MKRFRLSGAALAVVALVAAMVASAAYGITTAGVQGQMDFKSLRQRHRRRHVRSGR